MAKVGPPDAVGLFYLDGDEAVLAFDEQVHRAAVGGAQVIKVQRQAGVAALLVDLGDDDALGLGPVEGAALFEDAAADTRVSPFRGGYLPRRACTASQASTPQRAAQAS